jgi:hypothetical protein
VDRRGHRSAVRALRGAPGERTDRGRRHRQLPPAQAGAARSDRRRGAPATDIALADKIASLRYLRVSGRRLPKRKRAHYEATLAATAATARPALAHEVVDLLDALAEHDGDGRGNRMDDGEEKP